ncbi:hypothetical protein NEPAR04_1575 [Nematocida parisii]|nr:hypothetical protein NEPAR03_1807 [Nematocida parisii]KAI5129967.1 hypothetical protein NEPAR08_1786 [Nematocida parisii]KAI5142652.1 hypothetical protein NEPAR04_1575 [Nematocida parisii]
MKERQSISKNIKQFVIRNISNKNMGAVLLLITLTDSISAILLGNDISRADIIKVNSGLIINPAGGLSPSVNYMTYSCRFMKNLRMYWHGTYQEWSLKKNKISKENKHTIEYSKSIQDWKVHNKIDEDRGKNRYLEKFAQQLINMFPSENRRFSIESAKNDSFTRFLREHNSKSDDLYILASLFLLSEEIAIPIKIIDDKRNTGNKILTLKSKKAENGFYFKLSLTIEDKIGEEHESSKVYQKKTEEVIEFFKSLVNEGPSYCLKVPEEFSMPTTYEEFLKGNFLCNPKMLIRTYFFEYIDSVEMYEKFVMIVHSLITEQMTGDRENSSTTSKDHVDRIFKMLFLKLETPLARLINRRCYYADFCSFKKARDVCINTPFIDVAYTPSCIDRPKYIKKEGRIVIDKENSRGFQNCHNSILLAIFFCFTFDSSTKKYNTDHLPNAFKNLNSFFSRYTYIVKNISVVMKSKWNRVIDDLPSSKRSYNDDGSIANTGLLSMLYMMSDLVGSLPEIEYTINYIKNMLKKEKNYIKNMEKTKLELEELLQKVFSLLSRNKKVQVECNNPIIMTINRQGKLNKDLGAHISVLYDTGLLWHGIRFAISNSYEENQPVEIIKKEKLDEEGYSKEQTCSDKLTLYNKHARSDIEMLASKFAWGNDHYTKKLVAQDSPIELYNVYDSMCVYPNMIIKQFFMIEIESDAIFNLKLSFDMNKEKIVNSRCNDPNRLMLWGDLDDLEYKSHIIRMFSIYSSGENLRSDNPMVRFTSNLIGSVPLDDPTIRQHILSGYAYNKNYKAYYPQLDYNIHIAHKTKIRLEELHSMIESLHHIKEIDNSTILGSYISLLQAYRKGKEIPYLFSGVHMLDSIIKEIKKPSYNPKYMPWESQPKLNSEKSADHNIADTKVHIPYATSIFNYVHNELTDAMPSPVGTNLNIIYVSWLYNIINSDCSFTLEDIKLIYARINPYDLSRKIEDVLGYKLSYKNTMCFIEFLDKNKFELSNNPNSYEHEEKHLAIISLFRKYIKDKQEVLDGQ